MTRRTTSTARHAAERRLRYRAPAKPLYERDMYRWTRQQAKLLRAGKISELDLANLAEEIESLGNRDWRELKSRLTLIVMHLLKWQYQPEMRTRSWQATIGTQRREVRDLLAQSPSLRRQAVGMLPDVYVAAVDDASGETGLAPGTFPAGSPFTLDQILDKDYMPKD